MYMYYNQRHVTNIAPPPTFAFGKIVPSGLKMRAEHLKSQLK